MGRKKRFQIKTKQKMKRHKRLTKLNEKKLPVGDYFCYGRFIGPRKEK